MYLSRQLSRDSDDDILENITCYTFLYRRYNPMTRGPVPTDPAALGAIPDDSPKGYVLYVANIGPLTDEYDLYNLFAPHGTVLKVSSLTMG